MSMKKEVMEEYKDRERWKEESKNIELMNAERDREIKENLKVSGS